MPKPNPPKIHLNENLSPRLSTQLVKHGFDVTSSQEVGLLSTPDDKQLEHAVSQQRAIVTFNVRDFSDLHRKYFSEDKEHWGIIFSTPEPIGILLHRLLRLLHTVHAEELKNQIRWLNEFM
jgi:predicted nuclease of predicted toxin-antitoxin system